MQFNTTLIFKNLDGVNIKEQFLRPSDVKDKPELGVRDITTGIALSMVLLQPSQGQEIPATQWSDRYSLALQLRNSDVVELSEAQLLLCKTCASKLQDGLVAAQLCMYLEGKHPEWDAEASETPKARARKGK